MKNTIKTNLVAAAAAKKAEEAARKAALKAEQEAASAAAEAEAERSCDCIACAFDGRLLLYFPDS